MRKVTLTLPALLVSLCLIVGFQNCAPFREGAFQTIGLTQSNSGESDSSGSTGLPASISYRYSDIFVGGPSFIKGFRLDRSNDQVIQLPAIDLEGQTPTWFRYDRQQKRIFAVERTAGNLLLVSHDAATGLLSLQKTLSFIPGAVHLELIKTDKPSSYVALGSSYSGASWARAELDLIASALTPIDGLSFSSGAKTHSSAWDAERRLLFVANSGENKIRVFQDVESALVEVSEVDLVAPRTIVYDETFRRLYVATEPTSEQSYVKIYSIEQDAGSQTVDIVESGSFSMGLNGGEIVIDHAFDVAAVTVRELGAEGFWILPLGASGLFDLNRERRFVSVPTEKPRSIKISQDGVYYAVACNKANALQDLYIYKVSFTEQRAIGSVDQLRSFEVGAEALTSNLIVDVE